METIKIIPETEPGIISSTERLGCSGAPKILNQKNIPYWVTGILEISIGQVYQVSTQWTSADYWGMIKSRTSAFRMTYSIEPGLYAVGNPDRNSDILVTANYKLSFDILRRELRGMDAWILILDTDSINVWCAAGKGTFSSEELIKRMNLTRIVSLVDHRRIILPQLGAPGIDADQVKKITGFRVYYGPVRAADISQYIAQKYTATKEMRTVKFTVLGRLILTPIELNPIIKAFPKYAIIVLLIFGLQPSGILFKDVLQYGLPVLVLLITAILSGAFVTPLLLPFIPFRSFAMKGWIVGLMLITIVSQLGGMLNSNDTVMTTFTYLFFPAISSYLAMNFTGATTFTNLSGVKKELKIGMPIYKVVTVVSLILFITYKIKQWGLI